MQFLHGHLQHDLQHEVQAVQAGERKRGNSQQRRRVHAGTYIGYLDKYTFYLLVCYDMKYKMN